MDGWTNQKTDGWMDKSENRWMDGQIRKQMDGWTNQKTDGWMDKSTHNTLYTFDNTHINTSGEEGRLDYRIAPCRYK
jgi:hypothetical protein